eukprot:6213478-Pleurochrysis_carterae.AAC.2
MEALTKNKLHSHLEQLKTVVSADAIDSCNLASASKPSCGRGFERDACMRLLRWGYQLRVRSGMI